MNCDSIARWYRWFEYLGFGRALERRRYRFLRDVADARRILVLGDGDGRFLARLVEQNTAANPGVSIDYVDLSNEMLQLARKRAGTDGITYYHSDALAIELPCSEYDLMVMHFFLDCFEQSDAEALIAKLAGAARHDARCLISDFQEQSGGFRGAWSWVWLRTLYFFFRLTTGLRVRKIADYHRALELYGFRLSKRESARWGLLVSELWTRALDASE